MAEYQLYCFAQSGNAYRAALMLNLIGADWTPVYVDFFKGGETRTPKYRAEVNEMGEVPVLVHGDKKLTQSGVILSYLSDLTGKFYMSRKWAYEQGAIMMRDHNGQPLAQLSSEGPGYQGKATSGEAVTLLR